MTETKELSSFDILYPDLKKGTKVFLVKDGYGGPYIGVHSTQEANYVLSFENDAGVAKILTAQEVLQEEVQGKYKVEPVVIQLAQKLVAEGLA